MNMTDESDAVATIEGFCMTTGSGIAQLLLRGDDGEPLVVPCDAAPTVRALSSFVPGLLRGGAAVRVRLLEGVRVRFALDEIGVLAGIAPVEDDAVDEERR
jgi:hypothetical protein